MCRFGDVTMGWVRKKGNKIPLTPFTILNVHVAKPVDKRSHDLLLSMFKAPIKAVVTNKLTKDGIQKNAQAMALELSFPKSLFLHFGLSTKSLRCANIAILISSRLSPFVCFILFIVAPAAMHQQLIIMQIIAMQQQQEAQLEHQHT